VAPAAITPPDSLDALLAGYAAGDHAVVSRTFARSSDFQRHGFGDRRRLQRWLGAWQPAKARLAIELAIRAGEIAPAYTLGILGSGRDYVLRRGDAPGVSASDDALERRWHGLALAVLQARFYDGEIERYLDALAAARPRPAADAVWPERADFARAIAQEQRCRVLHTGARHDRLAADGAFAAATPPAEREAALSCVQLALTRFETASRSPASRDEARVRAGWALFQLGRTDDAQRAFEGIDAGTDRVLGYWLAIFRGRASDALGANADAEQAYRQALAAFPEAHTATVGLALTLFRMQRDDDAEDAARTVRQRASDSVDPWDIYSEGDARLLSQWLTALRAAPLP
jgi:tetratricopeptide (TPR) repeat protein